MIHRGDFATLGTLALRSASTDSEQSASTLNVLEQTTDVHWPLCGISQAGRMFLLFLALGIAADHCCTSLISPPPNVWSGLAHVCSCCPSSWCCSQELTSCWASTSYVALPFPLVYDLPLPLADHPLDDPACCAGASCGQTHHGCPRTPQCQHVGPDFPFPFDLAEGHSYARCPFSPHT